MLFGHCNRKEVAATSGALYCDITWVDRERVLVRFSDVILAFDWRQDVYEEKIIKILSSRISRQWQWTLCLVRTSCGLCISQWHWLKKTTITKLVITSYNCGSKRLRNIDGKCPDHGRITSRGPKDFKLRWFPSHDKSLKSQNRARKFGWSCIEWQLYNFEETGHKLSVHRKELREI